MNSQPPRNPEEGPSPENDAAASDEHWMRRALHLAQQSTGLASPNPLVGCVLVREGKLLGEGAHHYDRKDHAEIVALKAAGAADGATAYVTLEPCSHTGRTGPCAVALTQAGITRVVAATADPNPLVSGRGFALLRAAGIRVTVGVLQQQARALNDGFACSMRWHRPFVTLKAGLSLDGRIAPPPEDTTPAGNLTYLTGPHSLQAVQALRHKSDALLTGIGTVLHDDPLLTDRSGLPRRRPLLRVVLDTHLRLPLTSRLVQTAANDLLVCTAEGDTAHTRRRHALEQAGVKVHTLPQTSSSDIPIASQLDLPAVLHLLSTQFAILNVLAEGGSHLNQALLTPSSIAGEPPGPLADKLCLFYAPLLLGSAAVPFLAGPAAIPLALGNPTLSHSGADFRLDAYLRDPWSET